MKTEHFDTVVIGGGPGGSTAATLIAMQGNKVLLLEKQRLPAYKIGESLLPATIHGVCAMLGVSEELKKANFVRKNGGTFRWGRSAIPWTFAFAQSSHIQGPTSYAYQVERSKFDLILIKNAISKGVDVRQNHSVLELLQEGDRFVGVTYCDENGNVGLVLLTFIGVSLYGAAGLMVFPNHWVSRWVGGMAGAAIGAWLALSVDGMLGGERDSDRV